MKINLMYDYAEGCHPDILRLMEKTNFSQQLGYGDDEYTLYAQELIRTELELPEADVHFVSGGTMANLLVISSILKPYESVISANSGHIAVHETGAIEFTGHKINEILSEDGKLTIEKIDAILDLHADEHSVVPKIVYISNATELGNIYNIEDLRRLRLFCDKNGLYLFMDGARLATSLMSKYQDLKISDLKDFIDIFYIGGTKNGALLGEAIIIINDKLKEKFRYNMKQKGALLAKGRLLGIQFIGLFSHGLFYKNAQNANNLAERLANGLEQKFVPFLAKPETNMVFPIFSNEKINQLENEFIFHRWKKIDQNNTAIRLVTSWASNEEMIDKFIKSI